MTDLAAESQTDRIVSRYDVALWNGVWCWECPDCPDEYGDVSATKALAIEAARGHDESRH